MGRGAYCCVVSICAAAHLAGPGDRAYTDYVEGEDNAANPDRRTLYLTTTSDLLVTHLESVESEWAEGGDNYRASFVSASPEDGLRKVLTGMIILSGFETGGERLQTALDSGDQEDEHSCFSDNTHRDMIQDVQGIQKITRPFFPQEKTLEHACCTFRASNKIQKPVLLEKKP